MRLFEAVIEGEEDRGAWVEIPADVVDELGGGGRIPVTASFDGHPYRGSIAVYGGQHVLGVVKAVRRAIGKAVGDVVEVELALDEDERTVDIPVDVKNSLAAAGLGAQFDAMSYTKRRQAVDASSRRRLRTRGGAGSRSSLRSSARPIDAAMSSRHQAGHIS